MVSHLKHHVLSFAALLMVIACERKVPEETAAPTPIPVTDPLPSWNDGKTKQAIINFVTRIQDESSPDFIPESDRIATFDNDGTLWAEKPYVQELFVFYRVKEMVTRNPELAKKQPFKAVVEGDKVFLAKGGEKLLLELLAATHTGMSEDEFEKSTQSFFASTHFPGRNVPVKQIRYQPQLELLDYLRANGFKVFICTGGTIEFVRAISEDYYDVPPEQVIGSSFKYVFADSSKKIYRQPALNSFNDKNVKPTNIQLHIGKHPVLACGNEGGKGDIAMLMFSQTGKYPSLQLLVNHDDEAREFQYSEADSASLKAATKNGWQVISIKNDWKKVFPEH